MSLRKNNYAKPRVMLSLHGGLFREFKEFASHRGIKTDSTATRALLEVGRAIVEGQDPQSVLNRWPLISAA